ncbi:MAG: signal peptidase I [Bacilli bacterium]|nr:signal peptidase I [Bacilli bacterium]
MRVIKKIIKSLIIVFLLMILSYNIYNFVNIKILKNDITSINGYVLLEIASASMNPTLKEGDLIIINTKIKEYQQGDIITYYDEEKVLITHRIVKIDGDTIITQGDYNNTEDPEITQDKIIGVYVNKLNNCGKIINTLKSPLIMILIFVIGVLFCILTSINNAEEIDDKEFAEYLKEKENRK